MLPSISHCIILHDVGHGASQSMLVKVVVVRDPHVQLMFARDRFASTIDGHAMMFSYKRLDFCERFPPLVAAF